MRICARIWALVLVGAAVIMPHAALAQDEYRQDPYGSPGDIGIDLRCYGDRYVVGLTGRVGTNIDRIQLLCAKLGPDGLALPSDTKSVDVGGLGGGEHSKNCAVGNYLTYARVWLTTTRNQVYIVSASCSNPKDRDKDGFFFGAQYEPNGLLGPGYPTRDFGCPADMAVTGLTVRYGKHVNAIGTICGKIVLQPAPPVVTTPAGPARTGRTVEYGAKNGSPRPPAVKPPSFVGQYNLVSRSGGKLTLVINEGDGYDVFGTLTSADPRYNGALTGKVAIDGRNFTFTYRDAATGKTGSGKLKYNGYEAKAVIGGIISDDAPSAAEVWGGPRQ